MKHQKVSLTTLFTIIICVLLLAVNVALGAVLMGQSSGAMKSLIRKNMLAVVNTASTAINGDVLDSLTADDVGSEEYNKITATLLLIKNAQHDSDIKYIYIIDKIDGEFVYIVDPDPKDPADFGEEIVYTPSQEIAYGGKAAIDNEPVADEWGCYYSAWSPVFNSEGKVAGVVGIDFAGDWFDLQIKHHTASIIIASSASVLAGGLVIFILTRLLRRRFKTIQAELSDLSNDLDKLASELQAYPAMNYEHREDEQVKEQYFDSGTDIVNSMSRKIHTMQDKLDVYLEFIHNQAYTDSMTSVENKTAYLDAIKALNEQVASGTADFAVIIFDINGLKFTNDNYGHECGDMVIVNTAAVIKHVFGDYHVYRIGGDEFICIAGGATKGRLDELFLKLRSELDAFNEEGQQAGRINLSFSYGSAIYDRDRDGLFKEVFKRADEEMYRNKNRYYKEHDLSPSRNYEVEDPED